MRPRSRHSATPSLTSPDSGEDTCRRYREAQVFISKQRSVIDTMAQSTKELQSQFTNTSRELLTLKKQMQEMSASKVMELRREVDTLKAALRRREEENHSMKKELEDARGKIGAKDRHIARMEVETQQVRTNLEEKISILQAKEARVSAELDAHRKHLLDKHQKLEEAQMQLASATDTVQLLQSAVVEKENELNAVKAELAAYVVRSERLDAALKAARMQTKARGENADYRDFVHSSLD